MIFAITIMLTALILSTVAAFYSISGLTAIFPGAVVPIIIMGGTLEISKIVATVWLHKYWDRAALQFKLYLVPAIIILMIITSTGIFGFLSAAHLSQSTANEDISSQVSLLDEKIKTEQDNIATSKQALKQMDAQVDQLLGRTDDDKGANRAVQVRKQQAKERKSLQEDISIAQKNISTLQAEREPIAAKSRVAESHIGPIKYIAALIYGDNPDANLLERAVRWVIILLVLVFDPLALILILAAEQTVEWSREDDKKSKLQEAADQAVEWANTATPEEINKELDKIEGWHQEWVPDSEAWPEWDETATYEPDDGPLTDEQLEAIKAAAGNVEMVSMSSTLFGTEREFFDHGKEVARELDSNHGYLNKPWAWPSASGNVGLVPSVTVPEVVDGTSAEEFIKQLNEQLAHTPPATVKPEEPILITRIAVPESNPAVVAEPVIEEPAEQAYTLVNSGKTINVVVEPHHADKFDPEPLYPSRPAINPELALQADNDLTVTPVNAGFGTTFPANPTKGDMYLRVDYLPSKLFKWNDKRWIEVNKTVSEPYVYDTEYIKYLIDKIDSGEYEIDLITPTEQEQIQRYLNESK